MAMQFTDANFSEAVINSDKLSVVDFWAEWCGPCRMVGPIIEELATEYNGQVNVGKVDVDNNQQVSLNYGIRSIPTVLFIKNGQVIDKIVGAASKAIYKQKIEANK
ncbi:MAG: thioredoxin [Sphingobacteriales bacterium]|jgi:thioredoxin 1|nr:thioredoxin [Sphingobacteriales bacterium]MBP9142752.1 thioredoxin [Chitinophagales bacterium]MDA0199904.1 thioredoxin [Bacteroidota bacterium]MBK6888770.1 thioredoxin [Sphingobacteriales bacterium]MBK7528723.1 thioredoxin [Sphingobacteriales bacterium]